MKFLAILLTIISVFKLIVVSKKCLEIPIETYSNIINPYYLRIICCAIFAGDGLIGLLCGVFILFVI